MARISRNAPAPIRAHKSERFGAIAVSASQRPNPNPRRVSRAYGGTLSPRIRFRAGPSPRISRNAKKENVLENQGPGRTEARLGAQSGGGQAPGFGGAHKSERPAARGAAIPAGQGGVDNPVDAGNCPRIGRNAIHAYLGTLFGVAHAYLGTDYAFVGTLSRIYGNATKTESLIPGRSPADPASHVVRYFAFRKAFIKSLVVGAPALWTDKPPTARLALDDEFSRDRRSTAAAWRPRNPASKRNAFRFMRDEIFAFCYTGRNLPEEG